MLVRLATEMLRLSFQERCRQALLHAVLLVRREGTATDLFRGLKFTAVDAPLCVLARCTYTQPTHEFRRSLRVQFSVYNFHHSSSDQHTSTTTGGNVELLQERKMAPVQRQLFSTTHIWFAVVIRPPADKQLFLNQMRSNPIKKNLKYTYAESKEA